MHGDTIKTHSHFVWHNWLLEKINFIFTDCFRQRDSLQTAKSHLYL